jgi:hypothetical protein
MAIRSRLPWPLRWVAGALMLGFCAAIALWAFQLGKDIAGLDGGTTDELQHLRSEVAELRRQRDTSASVITAERAARAGFEARMKNLEAENRSMRDDLAFFEHLLPAGGGSGVAIRGLQAEVLDGGTLRWQVLLMQPARNAPEFHGRLEVSMSGTLNGQPWTLDMPGRGQPLSFRQYRRAEGAIPLPLQAVVKNVTAKVMDGNATRAVQTIQL